MTTAAERAAHALLARREWIAAEATAALHAADPSLHDRYGVHGREKCREDAAYNVQHLAGAMEMDDPRLFAAYVRWVDELLRARNVPTDDLRRHLGFLEDACARALAPDDRDGRHVLARCIAAGRDALDGGAA